MVFTHTCKDEGHLAGQLGSLRVPSTKSVSNAYAGSNREAYGNLQGEKENDQGRVRARSGTSSETALPRMCGSQLIHDGLSCQLHLTDDTGQESCDLIQPPLQTVHQHTGHGQLEEGTPLLQALSGPAFRRRRNAFTAVMAVASVKTFHFVGNAKPNWMLNIAGKDSVCSFLSWKHKM